MRDRLGKAREWNRYPRNPTQNIFVRFVRQPQAGLEDRLADYKRGWDEMTKKALRSRIEEM